MTVLSHTTIYILNNGLTSFEVGEDGTASLTVAMMDIVYIMACSKFMLSTRCPLQVKMLALFYNVLFWVTTVVPGKRTSRTLQGASLNYLSDAFNDVFSDFDFASNLKLTRKKIYDIELSLPDLFLGVLNPKPYFLGLGFRV